MYDKGLGVQQNYQQAVQWYRNAADQGDASAQYWLGVMYYKGQGVQQDYQQAVQWFRKAADQGHAWAQNWLGWMYDQGQVVQQDYQQAMQWYRKAADQGYASAQYSLGWMYTNGHGVQQDYQQAAQWHRKAADQGDADAQYHLGHMYSEGQGVTQDYEQAVQWYRKAADQGSSRVQSGAQVSLGWYYMNGFGNLPIDSINYKEAVYWNECAANNGDPEGFNNLGWLYENGFGVMQDFSKAAELYQNAITKGIELGVGQERIEEAKSRLANIQVQINAKHWIGNAAEQGVKDAQTNLERLYEVPKQESPIIEESRLDKLYKAAIGEGADYYLDIFKRFDANGVSVSWNWAAFLFGPLWLLSRNMVLYSLLYFLSFPILLGIFSIESIYLTVLVIFFNVFISLIGNTLYYFHVRKKINKVTAVYSDRYVQIDKLKSREAYGRMLLMLYSYSSSFILHLSWKWY
jgi:TPR repeat protein